MTSATFLRAQLEQLSSVINAAPDDSPSSQLLRASMERRREQVQREYEPLVSPVLRVVMRGKPVRGHQVFVDSLSKLIHELQESVSSIGQAMRGVATDRSAIPASIRQETAFRLVAVHPGSVELELLGPEDERVTTPTLFEETEDLRPEPLVGASVNVLLDLLVIAGRHQSLDDDLIEAVLPLGPRSFAHLKALANAVVDEEFDVDLGWRSPVMGERVERLDMARSRRLRDALGRTQLIRETTNIRGQLGGASLFRGAFELRTIEGDTVRGRVQQDLVPQLQAWFGRWVIATVETSVSTEAGTGRERPHYLLSGLASDPEGGSTQP
ncbi:hypothetical protein [Jatrophihabitans lederbergiae]|uniref:Uncharacterized protein n=1 Tax=Jatrophihabitans lederbergiae TaxID=3075547 RepID=A0ABU2JEM8_9ACTN|nr:hypothetical protein [Jatrophihabitans sp. DSM 44399]MDT0263196.1 hypothetical protein [Jatrophihabitans sp. DSM 44399]